jgi:hypothetical protein
MAKKAAFITVHGMGRTEETYNAEIVEELQSRLGSTFDNLHVGKVYYQGILQPNEDRVWNSVAGRVGWDQLRSFLLFGFADAAGLESGKEGLESVYSQTQTLIATELYRARKEMDGDGPVVMIAHSLGCQVASCYFWDAQQASQGNVVDVGIWQEIDAFEERITNGATLTGEDLAFIQGKSVRTLFTTGCNIPIFVAAHATEDILPIKPNNAFEWHNFYDRDDVLGWPLSELSDQYATVVRDYPVNAGGGIVGWILKSWNPLSHEQYWGDDEVLDPLESKLRELLA